MGVGKAVRMVCAPEVTSSSQRDAGWEQSPDQTGRLWSAVGYCKSLVPGREHSGVKTLPALCFCSPISCRGLTLMVTL